MKWLLLAYVLPAIPAFAFFEFAAKENFITSGYHTEPLKHPHLDALRWAVGWPWFAAKLASAVLLVKATDTK